MKRLSILLIALVAVLGLAACGEKETPVVSISVQVEEGWTSYYETVKTTVLAEMGEGYEINFITTGSFDHLDALDKTDATNTDIADVFAAPADRLYGLSENNYLAYLPATEMAARIGGWSDYDAGLGGLFKVDGNYVALPMNIETLIFFANTANATTNDVSLTNIELNDLSDNDMLVAYFNAWFGVAFTNAVDFELLGQDANGDLYTDATKVWADLTADQQSLFTHLFDYWNYHLTAGTDGAPDNAWDSGAIWGEMDTQFAPGGTSSLLLEGPWNAAKFEAVALTENFDILGLNEVTLNGKEIAHWKGGWGLVANARLEAEGKEEEFALAQAFMEEMVNPANAVNFYLETGKIMENVEASVYANSTELAAADKLVIAKVLSGYENAPSRPLFSEWGSVWSTWENAMLSWSTEGSQPTTAEEGYAIVKAAFEAMMLGFE